MSTRSSGTLLFSGTDTLLRVTRGARNPNFNVGFTNACVAVV